MEPNTTSGAPTAPAAAPVQPIIRQSALFNTSVIVLVLVLLGWGLAFLLTSLRGGSMVQLDSKITQLNSQIKEPAIAATLVKYNALETVVSHMQKLRNERFLFLPTWQAVKKSVPKDLQFSSFVLGDDATVRISGSAKTVASIAYFSNALSQNTNFRSVSPLSVDKQTGRDAYNFTLSFKVVSSGGDTTGDAQ